MDDDYSAAGDLESQADDQTISGDSASFAVVKQEIKMMNVVRTFVFALMITLSTIAAEVLFVVVRFNEENTFKDEFAAFGQQLVDGFYTSLQERMVVANSLATALSLQSQDMEAMWPYVSFSEFDMRCSDAAQLTGAASITLAPLVVNGTRAGWESYAGYVDGKQQGKLQSTTTNQTAEIHQEATVFYLDSNRTVQEGIYFMEKSRALDLGPTKPGVSIFPIWQRSPALQEQGIEIRMFDQESNQVRSQALTAVVRQEPAGTGVLSDFLYHDTNQTDYAFYATPRTALYYPVYASASRVSVVASLDFEFQWESFFQGVVEEGTDSIVVVVQSSCGRIFSFEVNGLKAAYLGEGDLHADPSTFDGPDPISSTFANYSGTFLNGLHNATTTTSSAPCAFRVQVYATEELRDSYLTNAPEIARWIVLALFLFTIGVFICYDCAVEIRSNRVVENAKRTDALVSTLFPSSVKQQLLEQAAQKRKAKAAMAKSTRKGWEFDQNKQSMVEDDITADSGLRSLLPSRHNTPVIHTPKKRLKSFLHPGDGIDGLLDINDSEPIADLFPNASVMFADIAGFTAWSSERDPSQVFKLLETLYRSMDKAARRFKVFKVETIGDCYVAATGLPDPREDHLEALVRFARTSLFRTNELTKALEAILGPGTSELALRFGIHSGPVTAGVLRGEKARFQLFGDTMNFAARMESTGVKNKIHLSEASADLLKKRGKGHWVAPRAEKVHAKGKGELQTYWLQMGTSSQSVASGMSGSGMSCSSGDSFAGSDLSSVEERHNVRRTTRNPTPGKKNGTTGGPGNVLMGVIGETKLNKSIDRLVEWNTSALAIHLKKVIVFRDGQGGPVPEQTPDLHVNISNTRSFMGELGLTIPLPGYNAEAVARFHEEEVDLPHVVHAELRFYVAAIASGYRKNSFHNFEHASHVILSATKLLKRIAYADGHEKEDGVTTEDLHSFTYGISSDPLTQFAVVFAALVHDVGHEGVPNGQLAKELPDIAALYADRAVAEQRSVDVALELLMLPKYKHLRECIYVTESEQKRFRQLLIHCVLATDIFDPDLKAQRNQRWDQAFHSRIETAQQPESPQSHEDMNTKATIVLEHIIQASDVSHTMQHWHVYIKWNERLYQEMYTAYIAGRAEKDPSDGWYRGELWFYDNYVIPLAKKLKECGVFGVSSEEYLTYAVQNRNEWEQRGESICKAMKERVLQLHSSKTRISSVAEEAEENLYREIEERKKDLEVDLDDEMEGGHDSLHSYSNH